MEARKSRSNLEKREMRGNLFLLPEPKHASGGPRRVLAQRFEEFWRSVFEAVGVRQDQGNPSDFPWIYLV